MAESRAKLFEESHGSIEEALRYVAFRRRLPPFEFQQLRSYVSLKLIENDYARLRKQSAEGSGGKSHVYDSREDLLRLAYALPVRHRPRFVSDDQASGCGTTVAVDPIERRESEVDARRLQAELNLAMSELNREDRRLLKMRFSERRTVPEIAANLDVDAKPLYARIRRLLARIRDRLESGGGLGGREAASYLAMMARTIDLDEVFAHAV